MDIFNSFLCLPEGNGWLMDGDIPINGPFSIARLNYQRVPNSVAMFSTSSGLAEVAPQCWVKPGRLVQVTLGFMANGNPW